MRALISFGLNMRALTALLVVAILGATGCVKRQDVPVIVAPAPVPQPGIFHPEKWPAPSEDSVIASRDPALISQIDSLLDRMTLRQKIGALIAVDEQYIRPEDLSTYPIGLIITDRVDETSLDRAGQYYRQALSADLEGGPFVPPLRFLDLYPAVKNDDAVDQALMFVPPIALGAAARGQNGPAQSAEFTKFTRHIGTLKAIQARRAGFDGIVWQHMNAEIDAGQGQPSGFDVQPERAAQTAAALLEGGVYGQAGARRSLVTAGPILGTYILPQNADLNARIHTANIDLNEVQLIELHGVRLTALAQAQPDVLMVTPQLWQGTALGGEDRFIQDYLRDRLGFKGLIMSARDGHAQIDGCSVRDCLQGLRAGLDIYYAGAAWRDLFDNLLQHAAMRRLDIVQIDRAVERILYLKLRSGAFSSGAPAFRGAAAGSPQLDDPEMTLIKMARSSAVLVKNRRRVLPLSPLDHIAIFSAEDMAADIRSVPAQLEDSFKKAITHSGGRVSVNDFVASRHADIALVILDKSVGAQDEQAIERLKQNVQHMYGRGIPIVLIVASQTLPQLSNDETAIFDMAQGVVLVWHPAGGTRGVADLVFASESGQIIYDFAAKLPFNWRIGTAPFYSSGFGLSYFAP